MQIIELNKVRKSYDNFVAVDDLCLGIKEGSVFGLLGQNGAGKTSSIRMMIGITVPDSGSVSLFGEPFARKNLQRLGYLPEERGLYRKMKVLDHLVFLGRAHGLDAITAKQKTVAWCERLEIASWLQKKVEELSKGMQQKVQFIATLLHDPDLIIMDEPFGGLDPVNATLLREVLLELKKQGKTILFSTHRMDQVEKLCDTICLINRGKAVLYGDLKQIKAQYGKNNVHIEYEGGDAFLQQKELVASYNDYGNYVEVQLADGADPQQLLRLVGGCARVRKFELLEPLLEQIFIEKVGKIDE